MRERVRVVVEIDDPEPISGALVCGDGSRTAFTGWLELISALTAEARVLDSGAAPADGPPTSRAGT